MFVEHASRGGYSRALFRCDEAVEDQGAKEEGHAKAFSDSRGNGEWLLGQRETLGRLRMRRLRREFVLGANSLGVGRGRLRCTTGSSEGKWHVLKWHVLFMSTQDSDPPVRTGVSALDAAENDLVAAPDPNSTPFRPSFVDSYVNGDAAPNSTQDAEG
jgi:hypothetical protein